MHLCTVLMHNPNFLELDEPTNGLDITTLSILEEYMQNFKGCVIVVSHDRYFMDKVVEHIWVFKGNGEVKDFPGNYTDYREWRAEKTREERMREKAEKEKKGTTKQPEPAKKRDNERRRLTFKEKKELEELNVQLSQLGEEKSQLEAELNSGSLSTDKLYAYSKRISELITLIDEKEMRWLELSEIEEA